MRNGPVTRLLSPLRMRAGRLWRDARGIAAIEFALLFPVLMTLYIGTVETTQVLTADRRVILLGSTLADITSQASKLSGSDLSGLIAASSSVLSPLSSSAAKIRLSSVSIATVGSATTATVCWSYATNWTAYARGVPLDTTLVPDAMRTQSPSSLILAEVDYTYRPVIAVVLTGSFNLQARQLMRPRSIQYVERTDMAGFGRPSPMPGPCA
jgi:Flp pilus assembly protein TadG